MVRGRGAASSHGVVALLKPPGMTSHDAVAFVRRLLGQKQVGHTGTLDPAAAGVLTVCVGQATRLSEFLQAGTKEYVAEAVFGFETDSGDLAGEPVRRWNASGLTRDAVEAALASFQGEITQTPPLHSAVKVDGKRLYEVARAGGDAPIPEREVTVSRLELRAFWAGAEPRALLHLTCSGGTFVRSLVRDIGRALGGGSGAATMSFLVRSRNGAYGLNDAVAAEEWEHAPVVEPLPEVVERVFGAGLADDAAVLGLWQGKVVRLGATAAGGIGMCRAAPESVVVHDAAHTLFALARPVEGEPGCWRAHKVFDLRKGDPRGGA